MKIPRHQPTLGDECLRACAAAIFELPVKKVPHFIHEPGGWEWALRKWAVTEFSMDVRLDSYLKRTRSWQTLRYELPLGYYIGIIAPNTKEETHAVVMHDFDVVYDPALVKRKRYQKRGMGVIEFFDLVIMY